MSWTKYISENCFTLIEECLYNDDTQEFIPLKYGPFNNASYDISDHKEFFLNHIYNKNPGILGGWKKIQLTEEEVDLIKLELL